MNKKEQKIPKIIHYVWPGQDEKKGLSKICIQTWRDILPNDWEIKEWNFDTFDFEYHKKHNRFFNEVCKRKLYAFIADYVRTVVLYEEGGIYLDTDVSLLKPFEESMLLNQMFLAIQNEKLVEPAIWGAIPKHPFTKRILDFYNNEIWNCPEFIMPNIFAKYLKSDYNIQGFEEDKTLQKIFSTKDNLITFYPEKYFIPYRFKSQYLPTCIEPETTTIHWFRGSWCNNNLDFLRTKHLKQDVNKINVKHFPKHKGAKMNFIQKIFSVRNEISKKKKYKVLTILGIKMKFKMANIVDKASTTPLPLPSQKDKYELLLQQIANKLAMKDNIWQINKTKFYTPLYPVDFIQKHLVDKNEFFEQHLLKELDQYLPEDAIILDLGANIGNHTLYWLTASTKNINKVYSFEPVKETFDILQKNIELNNLQDRVNIYNVGLYDKETNAEIAKFDMNNIGGTSLKEGNGDLILKRLDDIQIDEAHIDFMKIDVENLELQLLKGGVQLINKFKPTIFIESWPDFYSKVNDFLIKNGYKKIKNFDSHNYLYIHESKIN